MIPPNILLGAYSMGYFPMADDKGNISWYSPDPRGIIPLDNYNIPRSTKQLIKKQIFRIGINRNFEGVIKMCARRKETWINEEIIESYLELHKLGFAHSVESFSSTNKNHVSYGDPYQLVGGLYGVAIGSAFFGESMFSLKSGASKVALAFLMKHLSEKGFTLLDIQYLTPHLQTFGAIEIPKKKYMQMLHEAIMKKAKFTD
jgi:leucyl/phenylalanyl-tRNA--protein transferase